MSETSISSLWVRTIRIYCNASSRHRYRANSRTKQPDRYLSSRERHNDESTEHWSARKVRYQSLRGVVMRFRDRTDAGRQLARRLEQMGLIHPVVLALPRGGVPVAFEAADTLDAPLDVFVARKVGAPGHNEYGIGAIAEGGVVVADEYALRTLGISQERFEQLVAVEKREVERRVQQYRRGRDLVAMRDRDVVLIDDGLATGVTAEAALRALRQQQPGRLILAVPACAPDAAARLEDVADEVVCLIAPAEFAAVGWWYANFDQTSDDAVLDLLDRASETSRNGYPMARHRTTPA